MPIKIVGEAGVEKRGLWREREERLGKHQVAEKVMESWKCQQWEQQRSGTAPHNNDKYFYSLTQCYALFSAFTCYLTNLQQSYTTGTIIIPHLSVRKLRHKDVTCPRASLGFKSRQFSYRF